MRALLAHVDAIRLDHFRVFVAAWHVPKGAATAQTGEWIPGPGAAFFRAIQKELGCLPFIAEDLGIITPEVRALRDELAVPGTRVLQFAFDGHSDNPYLPSNYSPNTVVYTGTHDNATTREWYEDLPEISAAKSLELPRTSARPAAGGVSGVDPFGLVFCGSARDYPSPGCSQSWQRGQDERARPSGGKLVLAML